MARTTERSDDADPSSAKRTRRRLALISALVMLALAALASPGLPQTAERLDEEPAKPRSLFDEPLNWLPADETLTFKVEATYGPVRGLDLGNVRLACAQAAPPERAVTASAPLVVDLRRLLASIDAQAEGSYLGRTVQHSIAVRWYAGTQPRIEMIEQLRGSRVSDRELRVSERDGQWQLEYRKDRHCKGCKDPAHFTDGVMPWSKPSHCDDCERLRHRVWRGAKRLDVPPDAVDIVSALYLARGFLRSEESSTVISLVNHDELWSVRLERGPTRKLETPAGEFDCVRVHISPELAVGDGTGEEAAERFEALFGLHGDILVWVDRERGFPVVIEGTAPFGPFDVHVKASLTSHRGG